MAQASPGVVAVIGVVALAVAGRAVWLGEVNLGGKNSPDYWVSFESQPLLFGGATLFMAVMGGLCLLYWWRHR